MHIAHEWYGVACHSSEIIHRWFKMIKDQFITCNIIEVINQIFIQLLSIFYLMTAKHIGISLYDCLAKGSDVLTNMLGVLLRLRYWCYVYGRYKIQVCVYIFELEQRVHRLISLWWEMDLPRNQDEHV